MTMVYKACTIVFWLIVWQIVSLWIDNIVIVPSPLSVWLALLQLSKTPLFWNSVYNSAYYIIVGFGIGTAAGVVLAVLAYKFWLIRQLLSPIITVSRAIPVASFIIFLLVVLSSKHNLSSVVAIIMVLPIVYSNTLLGLGNIDDQLKEMAQVFGVSTVKKYTYIYAYNLLPYINTGCRISVGLAFKSGVAAELIGVVKDSIGNQLQLSKLYIMMDHVIAWTVVVVVVSVLFECIVVNMLRLVEDRLAK